MKLVKLSVAAAMAAGLATSASAVELTEAIKGVDLNGYVRYRLESSSENDNEQAANGAKATTDNHHKYKYRFIANVPVNDDVNFIGTVGNIEGNTLTGEADLHDNLYANSDIGLIHAYFQYTGVENLTVQMGKQAMPTPFNDDEHGNGLVALYNVGPVTLAGGYFDSTNALGTANNYINDNFSNVMAFGVTGSVEMVNFSAWYADHEDTFDAYTVDVNGDIMDMVTVGIRHTQLDQERPLADATDPAVVNPSEAYNAGTDTGKYAVGIENKLTKIYASADIENFNLRAAYAKTGSEGGRVAYDGDADTGFNLENANLNGLRDATAYHLGANATFDKFTVGVDYVDGEQDTAVAIPNVGGGTLGAQNGSDFSELMPSVRYQMSDNFNVSALHAMFDQKPVGGVKQEETISRVEVRYDF